MYPTQEEKAVIDDAEKFMVETMARYDPSHDAFHGKDEEQHDLSIDKTRHSEVQRVRRTALMIARSLEISPDLLTVELAAILHDVLDKKYVTPEQASDPYSFFLPLFQQAKDIHGIDLIEDGRARQISLIVDNISWTTEKKLREAGQWTHWHNECIELHCVQDADRLDAIGAFGVMRCAAYNAVRNSVLYAPLDDSVRPQSAIQHFHDKLLHIKDRLKTEAGKTMGVQRHKVLLDFIQSLEDEYNVTFQ